MNTVEPSRHESQLPANLNPPASEISLDHYMLILLHRKWLVLAIFILVSASTAIVTYKLPNQYTSETLILVDPQQVPDAYVHPTVSGDVRNRLGTLSQQILSATRLEKVIETFSLYPEERKKLPREDVIGMMRRDIAVKMVSDAGTKQDLEAFRISYSGKDPRIVAQVTNELASLFIEENLKAREQMASGTSDFMETQLVETRKQLEAQEATIRDFKMKHLGEMPEQQQSNISILGQLQARLQLMADTLSKAEEQKSYLQNLISAQSSTQSIPAQPAAMRNQVVGINVPETKAANVVAAAPLPSEVALSQLLTRYGPNHPDVKRLKLQVEQERQERAEKQELEQTGLKERKALEAMSPPAPAAKDAPPDKPQANGVASLQAQLVLTESEITKYKQDQEKLVKSIAAYQEKLEAVPMREQEVSGLMRDYAISKEHYSQLLEKKLSAQMATQLEIRQKGEKFTILDPAQVPQKPSKPNRPMLDAAGAGGGLMLGLLAALSTELLGGAVTSSAQVIATAGFPVLGEVPIIITPFDRRQRRRWLIAGATSALAMVLILGALLLLHFRGQLS